MSPRLERMSSRSPQTQGEGFQPKWEEPANNLSFLLLGLNLQITLKPEEKVGGSPHTSCHVWSSSLSVET